MVITDKSGIDQTKEKSKAVAFINWQVSLKDGRFLRSSRGFRISQNPDYPNPQEDYLVKLARENGGSVTVSIKCQIMIKNGRRDME